MLKFSIPTLPPSLNSLYPGKERRYKSQEGKAFDEFFYYSTLKYRPKKPLEGNLRVEYTFYRKDKRRFDICNLEKALSDALVKCGFMKDDSQIRIIHLQKIQPADENKTEITIDQAV